MSDDERISDPLERRLAERGEVRSEDVCPWCGRPGDDLEPLDAGGLHEKCRSEYGTQIQYAPLHDDREES